jgi:hypothetical protein
MRAAQRRAKFVISPIKNMYINIFQLTAFIFTIYLSFKQPVSLTTLKVLTDYLLASAPETACSLPDLYQ